MLDNRYALLFIRGERPVRDFKFDILKHPNIEFTEDGYELLSEEEQKTCCGFHNLYSTGCNGYSAL